MNEQKKQLSTHPGIAVYDKHVLSFIPAYTKESADNFVVNDLVPREPAISNGKMFYTGWLKAGKEISLVALEPGLPTPGNGEFQLESTVSIKRLLIETFGEYLVVDLSNTSSNTFRYVGLRRDDRSRMVLASSEKLRIFKDAQTMSQTFLRFFNLFAARVKLNIIGDIDVERCTIRVDAAPVQYKNMILNDEQKMIPTTGVDEFFKDAKIVGFDLQARFSLKKRIA